MAPQTITFIYTIYMLHVYIYIILYIIFIYIYLYILIIPAGANNKYQFGKPGAAQKAGSVLGVSTEELARAIFSPSVQVRSPVR